MRIRRQKNTGEQYKWDLALTGTAAVTEANRWAVHFHQFDDDARKVFWHQHKAGILKSWISEKPGTRPFDWWVFDAPGFRLKLSDAGPSNEHLAEIGGGSDFGVPDHYYDDFEIMQDSPIFESEAAFLLRHKLMTQGEQKRLKNADYEPETLK